MSIARSDVAGTARLTGSLTTTAPAAIIVEALPLNVSGRDVPALMAASLSRSATWAAPTSSGSVPNALLSTTRTRSPPSDVCTISRSVWFLKLIGGGGAGAFARPPPGGGPKFAAGAHADPAGAAAAAAAGGP